MFWKICFIFALSIIYAESGLDLAHSYEHSGQYQLAIDCYLKRLQHSSSQDERWICEYHLGCCFEKLSKWDQALCHYLEAYQSDPERPDPIWKIARYYRFLGHNYVSYLFAQFGSKMPLFYPNLHRDVFDFYLFDEELSIVSYYTPFKEDGMIAVNQLLLKKEIPSYLREQASQNVLFYVEPLPDTSYLPVMIDLPLIREGIRYNPMNPSIVTIDHGYRLICRAVNYTQTGARDFHTFDEQGIYQTRNFFVEYDDQFRLLSQKEMCDVTQREKIGAPLVQGFEDCRLFQWKGDLWFTCTTTDTNPTGSYQISLGHCKESIDSPIVEIDWICPLNGPDPYRYEKNWLPFVSEDKLYLLYQYDPITIYTPDLATGHCICVHNAFSHIDSSRFRGSAGPILLDGGYLVMVHEVTFLPDRTRAYTHRFILFNLDWTIRKVTRSFIFKHVGVEYCCSMSWDHAGQKIIFPIGVEDREAFIGIIDPSTIRALFL